MARWVNHLMRMRMRIGMGMGMGMGMEAEIKVCLDHFRFTSAQRSHHTWRGDSISFCRSVRFHGDRGGAGNSFGNLFSCGQYCVQGEKVSLQWTLSLVNVLNKTVTSTTALCEGPTHKFLEGSPTASLEIYDAYTLWNVVPGIWGCRCANFLLERP